MLARRDTRREATRLRRLSPLQTLEDQSQTWGIRCHSCTRREGLSPSWKLSYKTEVLRFTREPRSSFNQRIARLLMSHAQHDMTVITPGTPIWLPQLDFLTNPCSSAAVVQAGVSMRRHNTPPRKLAGMPASSQCLTSPVTGCTKTDPPSPGPGSGTLGTQPEESVATRASKSRKTPVMSLPAERDPGLSVFMLRLLSGQANRFPVS